MGMARSLPTRSATSVTKLYGVRVLNGCDGRLTMTRGDHFYVHSQISLNVGNIQINNQSVHGIIPSLVATLLHNAIARTIYYTSVDAVFHSSSSLEQSARSVNVRLRKM